MKGKVGHSPKSCGNNTCRCSDKGVALARGGGGRGGHSLPLPIKNELPLKYLVQVQECKTLQSRTFHDLPGIEPTARPHNSERTFGTRSSSFPAHQMLS